MNVSACSSGGPRLSRGDHLISYTYFFAKITKAHNECERLFVGWTSTQSRRPSDILHLLLRQNNKSPQ
jgi:hypothetical protein